METPEFQAGLDALMRWARDEPTAVMCAEALPFRCHRQLLSDALLVQGFPVFHIVGSKRKEEHRLPAFARTEDDHLVYDGGTLDLLSE